ncbi:MAG: pantetheine-phosphate adenylyltransferase [Candidatus Omnitrophica bacterium]|nr:pantetheine-phosphate adenylyltransferase [Candidatus Omnitrophota bacterium]
MKMKAVCPGTFDPITYGHIDIARRASQLFDEVIIAVAQEPLKNTMFSFQERLDLVTRTTSRIERVKTEPLNELIVQFCRKRGVRVIVRGVRMISDFEYEFQMALTNRSLAPEIETVFLMPNPQFSFISSRLIREAADYGGDLSQFLPETVINALRDKRYENRG